MTLSLLRIQNKNCKALLSASLLFELEVSLKNTEVIQKPHPLYIFIGVPELKAVHRFTYQGYTITPDTKIDKDVDNKLVKVSCLFGQTI